MSHCRSHKGIKGCETLLRTPADDVFELKMGDYHGIHPTVKSLDGDHTPSDRIRLSQTSINERQHPEDVSYCYRNQSNQFTVEAQAVLIGRSIQIDFIYLSAD